WVSWRPSQMYAGISPNRRALSKMMSPSVRGGYECMPVFPLDPHPHGDLLPKGATTGRKRRLLFVSFFAKDSEADLLAAKHRFALLQKGSDGLGVVPGVVRQVLVSDRRIQHRMRELLQLDVDRDLGPLDRLDRTVSETVRQ